MSQHATMWDPGFRARLTGLEAQLTQAGISPPTAHSRALAMLYGQVQQQATTLGYVDTVFVVGVMCACMVPLVFIMKRNTGGMPQGASVHDRRQRARGLKTATIDVKNHNRARQSQHAWRPQCPPKARRSGRDLPCGG